MRINKAFVFPVLAVCVILSGCQQKSSSKNKAAVFRLFDLFQPEDLSGKVTPENAGWKRTEWKAQEIAPWTPPPKLDTNSPKLSVLTGPALGLRAFKDLAELKNEQSQLKGDITGPAPILHFALKENRGGAESVKFIEVRMNISGAKEVWLRSEGDVSPDESAVMKWASQSEPWKGSSNVVEGKINTYQFDVSSSRGSSSGGGGKGADVRHFFMTFRECKSAKFSIESIRFVSEREEKLNEPSGQQWAGLAEIYHAALAAKTPESIRIPGPCGSR